MRVRKICSKIKFVFLLCYANKLLSKAQLARHRWLNFTAILIRIDFILNNDPAGTKKKTTNEKRL
jgi:hypothetical protein